TGVNGSARSTHRSTQLVRHLVQHFEVVTVLHAATTRNDDLGSSQLRTVALGQFFAHEGGNTGISGCTNLPDCSRTTLGSNGVKRSRTHGQDVYSLGGLHGSNRVTGIDRALEGFGIYNSRDFRNHLYVQQRSNARQEVLAIGSGRSQDVAVAFAHFGNQCCNVLGQLVTVGSVI